MTFTPLAPILSDPLAPSTTTAAGSSRQPGPVQGLLPRHTESDFALPHLVRRARTGPAGRPATAPGAVGPVDAGDPPVQPSTVPGGFRRGRVLPDLRHRRIMEESPAEHVRRPRCLLSHPRSAHPPAVRGAAHRRPGIANPCDFALVAMLGLLGLRIFEASGADIADLGEEHGHRVLRVCGKGAKIVLVPLPPAVGRAIDPAIGDRARGPVLLNRRGARMDRHAATRACATSPKPPASKSPEHIRTCSATLRHDHARCRVDLRDVRSPPATPTRAPRCDMTGPKNLDRHPNYILAAYMASGT